MIEKDDIPKYLLFLENVFPYMDNYNYQKKLFQTIGNIIELIEKDDIPKYLLFLENAFPYMDNYNYHIGTDSDRALLLDFQATLETKPEKAIKLEKDALAQIENITADNARLRPGIITGFSGNS
ncbi:archaeal ATPase [Anaerobutyricum hallii CAG:12]|nr:archaeal ATPase [Anaerobutyricum hallii CAG:12]